MMPSDAFAKTCVVPGAMALTCARPPEEETSLSILLSPTLHWNCLSRPFFAKKSMLSWSGTSCFCGEMMTRSGEMSLFAWLTSRAVPTYTIADARRPVSVRYVTAVVPLFSPLILACEGLLSVISTVSGLVAFQYTVVPAGSFVLSVAVCPTSMVT